MTDGRQREGWEGAGQGREMFFFHFTGWEGGGGCVCDKNAEQIWGKWEISSSGSFDPSEQSGMCFLSSGLLGKTGFEPSSCGGKILYW